MSPVDIIIPKEESASVSPLLKCANNDNNRQGSLHDFQQLCETGTLAQVTRYAAALARSRQPEGFPDRDVLRKSFSKWTYPEVCRQFGLNQNDPPTFTLGSLPVPDEVQNNIVRAIKTSAVAFGPPSHNSEKKKTFSAFQILSELSGQFRGSITVNLDSNGPGPNVEFIVKVVDTMTTVLIIEANRDDMNQALAQILLELHTAHCENEARGLHLPAICGIIYTGLVWQFVRYKGSYRFEISHPMTFFADPSKGRLRSDVARLAGTIWWCLLTTWVEALEASSGRGPAPSRSTSSSVVREPMLSRSTSMFVGREPVPSRSASVYGAWDPILNRSTSTSPRPGLRSTRSEKDGNSPRCAKEIELSPVARAKQEDSGHEADRARRLLEEWRRLGAKEKTGEFLSRLRKISKDIVLKRRQGEVEDVADSDEDN